MTRYIALLRGINVGAGNRIRMEALRRLFEEHGFSGVEAYIQSGNVLFSYDRTEVEISDVIVRLLLEGAQIKTTVVLRNSLELHSLVSACPFSAEEIDTAQRENTEGESFYVALLPQAPAESVVAKLNEIPADGDRFVIVGRDVYVLLRRSIRNSKLAVKLQKLLPEATLRNWNTITKLNELAK